MDAKGTEKQEIIKKFIMLTYPIEYGNVLTPQPVTIYDKNPPTAVRQINTEEVPIASIKEKPRSEVNIAIKNTPPPIPKSPDEKPTKRPMIPLVSKLKEILASSRSLFMSIMFLTTTNSSKQPNIISNTLDGSPDATNPPTAPPIIPKTPS